MDVELLRPGTVPISPETVLWFEFLLDGELLLKHLQKNCTDPSPTELITKFYDVITRSLQVRTENENGEIINIEPIENNKVKHFAKNTALKILSIKVIAHLKWNLTKLRSLPFKTQINLLQDLIYFTNNSIVVELPNIENIDISSASPPFLFALLVYHRWLLNTSIHRITSNWQIRFGLNEMNPVEESIFCSQENVEKTVTFLTESLKWEKIPDMLTFDCFKLPTETNDNIEFNWFEGLPISIAEFAIQINYDLGTFFFYKEEYDLAKKHFNCCIDSFKSVSDKTVFLEVDKAIVDVYIQACYGSTDGAKGTLLEQLNTSIVKQYMGITTILQQDNVLKKIPLCHRINLELDIQGALSSGTFTVARDLLIKIKALNVVRCVLDQKPLYQYSIKTPKDVEHILKAIHVSWNAFSPTDKIIIKRFFMDLLIKNENELLPLIQSYEAFDKLFDKADLQFIKNTEVRLDIPESLNRNGFSLFDVYKKRVPKLEARLEQQLLSTYDHVEIKEILVKLATLNVGSSVWGMNPLWHLPIPLQSVIKSFPRGYMQDFSFVLLCKSKEQMLNKNWNSSLELLIILNKELQMMTQNENVLKMYQLVSWEILLVQITQHLDEWPKFSIDKNALANACEVCLQTNDTVLPRIEIKEQCVICLLNLGRWEFLINFDKRWSTFEITCAIALAAQEAVKHKGTKPFSKNIWELVLPIFITSNSKRSSNNSYNESQILNMKMNMIAIFSKLNDSMTLAVVIALLTKLYNILKDESSLELQVEYANLWPEVLSNAKSYNTTSVSEVLSELVLLGLSLYPTNVSWLRLMGDINYANGHYKVSLNYYLKSLLICNEYFNIPLRNDDHVFRRMIKCCTALGCQTQAAVLCQFLEKPDYTLAFRILGEQKTCNDAVDAYYHCFWDTNILEYLIHNHNKKGEFQRRKCAVQVIGLLELNSNNNEEIQREASNLRKSIFLRALCKQYVF